MQKDAQRLQQLIQEILELSRGSATIPYAEQEITLEKFITEILGSYQQQLAAKQLKTVVHGLPESQFFTKYELFYPIVKNLIENPKKMVRLLFLMLLKISNYVYLFKILALALVKKTKNGSLNGSIVSIKHVAVILVAPV